MTKLNDLPNLWKTQELPYIEDWNTSTLGESFKNVCWDMLRRRKPGISISKIYQPLRLLQDGRSGAVERLTPLETMKPYRGYMFEVFCYAWMNTVGCRTVWGGKEVSLPHTDGGLVGHIDGFCPEENTVIDFKSLSPTYYNRLTPSEDSRGYITQLSCYAYALGVEKCAIIAHNADSNLIKVVQFNRDMHKIQSSIEKWNLLNDPTTPLAAYPEPVMRGGKLCPPDVMRYHRDVERIYPECF